MSSLVYKALCMVIRFLVLWSICLCSSLVPFKNGPEYPTRVTALQFIPLIRLLSYSLVLGSFLDLLRYSFLIFFLLSQLVWLWQLPIFSSIWTFPFTPSVLIFSWFGSSIPSFNFYVCTKIFACGTFLNSDSNLISHAAFDLLSMVFRGTWFFHRLILLMHRLGRLIPGCCSLGYLPKSFIFLVSDLNDFLKKAFIFFSSCVIVCYDCKAVLLDGFDCN